MIIFRALTGKQGINCIKSDEGETFVSPSSL